MRKAKGGKMNQTKNIPEKKFSTGVITATVWQNQGRGKNGEVVGFRTVSFQRSYKDKKGVWQNSSSLRINDLPKAALVLQKAYEYSVLRGAQENAAEYANDEYSNEEIIEEII